MKTILVVDDERHIVDLLRLYLEQEGFAVVAARDGHEALRLAERHDPDLIVLDLMLGELDGLSICEILRAQPSTSDIPVIVITAMEGTIPRFHALDSGATDYLTKPFSPRDLLQRAERIILRR